VIAFSFGRGIRLELVFEDCLPTSLFCSFFGDGDAEKSCRLEGEREMRRLLVVAVTPFMELFPPVSSFGPFAFPDGLVERFFVGGRRAIGGDA